MRKLVIVLAMGWMAACGQTKPAPQPPAPRAAAATGAVNIGLRVDGQPYARALVTIGDQTQLLGDDGKARFELPAGDYVGRIGEAGIDEVRFKVTVVAGKETVHNMSASSVNTKDAN